MKRRRLVMGLGAAAALVILVSVVAFWSMRERSASAPPEPVGASEAEAPANTATGAAPESDAAEPAPEAAEPSATAEAPATPPTSEPSQGGRQNKQKTSPEPGLMAGASDEEAGGAASDEGETQESGAAAPSQPRAQTAAAGVPYAPSSNELERSSYTPTAPVYNAIFSPKLPGMLNGLVDRQKTQVDFYIGKPSEASAIPAEKASVNKEILSQRGMESLTITLTCGFCDGKTVEEQVIQFSPATSEQSTTATFHIVPNRRLTKDGMANLAFQIKNMGIVYDNIVLDVYVGNAGQPAVSKAAGSNAQPSAEVNVLAPPDARPADLTITCFQDGNSVAVTLDPGQNAQLIQLFRGRRMKDATHPRVFHTGITLSALLQIERNDYFYLSSLVDQSPDLTKALSGDPQAGIALSGSTTLTADEEGQLLDRLYDQGQTLYRKLFINTPDADLRDLMTDFDAYSSSGAPALIRIETHSINIPWQFLYPPVSKGHAKDPGGFWGFRYEVVVDPLAEKAPGYYPNKPLEYGAGPLLLATYRAEDSDPANDREVSSEGKQMAIFLDSQMGFKGITKVNSRKGFLNELQTNGPVIQMLVAFTHAMGDTALQQSNDGEIQVTQRLGGPELRFSNNEYITLDTLDELSNDLPAEEELLLTSRPLVLLNGCETGAAALYEGIDRSFPAEFLQMGARGVIATEAPIWTSFGYDFGSALMLNMKSGQTASLALLHARQAFLRSHNNPLGLLYSYYGGVKTSFTLR